jgi:phosphogluconate dehydratase
MTSLHPVIDEVTKRVIARSKETRHAYLEEVASRRPDGPSRKKLSAGNQAHASAGCALHDKEALLHASWPNIGIVTAYNDMLSAHPPYEGYPEIIRKAARKSGATAQVAGGVPAMCDGVTQGREGMELSLFSRDVIAMSTAVSLSHDTYDAALYLGVCDKIVPGLLIGALSYGHIPAIFVPAGPMPSGLPNKEKIRIRQLFAQGKVGRDELLKAESESYHSPGTCTFYGTANSNQMLMEVMGLHLPGAAFVNPGKNLREALTAEAAIRATKITALGETYIPVADIVSEKAIVNAAIGLMATGGSTNHTIHIPAIAKAAGIDINWDDFAQLSDVIPLLTRIYPNGSSDVNHFHAAGGMGFLIKELLQAGLLHADVKTIMGRDLWAYAEEPIFQDSGITWRAAPDESGDDTVLGTTKKPFATEGGLRLLSGPLGRGVSKVSAVAEDKRFVKAPARVFNHQDEMLAAFNAGELTRDFVAVVRFQGPQANGMPELHKLTPSLGVLQDQGYKVALVTDGRMSGASGKVPAAIHVGPEAMAGGPLARVHDGDVITVDLNNGELMIDVPKDEFDKRDPAIFRQNKTILGGGRDLFSGFRKNCSSAETGGTSWTAS